MSLAKVKFTPLSLVIACCIAYGIYLLLGLEKTNLSGVSPVVKAITTFIVTIILFFTDILFRRFIPNMKWLWLIQASFIILIGVLILIFQKI